MTTRLRRRREVGRREKGVSRFCLHVEDQVVRKWRSSG